MPRHNEDLIQMGIAMFKKTCSDAKQITDKGKPTMWVGHSCAGGGWKIRHCMNEDSMTPLNVAMELELNSITRPAKAAYMAEIMKQSQRYIDQ